MSEFIAKFLKSNFRKYLNVNIIIKGKVFFWSTTSKPSARPECAVRRAENYRFCFLYQMDIYHFRISLQSEIYSQEIIISIIINIYLNTFLMKRNISVYRPFTLWSSESKNWLIFKQYITSWESKQSKK